MPRDDGDRAVIEPETARARSWPCLRQFCVFLENRVGRLCGLLKDLESLDVRVLAISIVDSVDCANVRLIFNPADRAREKLELANYLFSEADVVGVELDDGDKPLTDVCTALLKAELNIHHVAMLRYRNRGKSAAALYVDDVDLALRTLEDAGLQIVTEGDLADQDEYL
jgi:hypothetical protein